MNQSKALEYWDEIHRKNAYKRETILTDDWLKRFEPYIETCTTPILDLGCGGGNNTRYLIERKKQVIACDFSKQAVKAIAENFPEAADTKCFDMTDGIPFADGSFELVIADLCLHYFLRNDTEAIVQELKRILKKNGHLLFRVNSINDTNHGAGQGEEKEEHVYQTGDGRLKRFFTEEEIRFFFRDFNIEYLKEETMTRYMLEKKLFRVCAERP